MQDDFLKGLNTIRNAAALKNGTLSVQDILAAFPGLELSDAQIALIYDYLERENITLEDYEPHDVNTLELEGLAEGAAAGGESEREAMILDMYREDLAAIPPLSQEEEARLQQSLLSGSSRDREAAAHRLTEGNLRWVVSIAGELSGKGAALPDLIQEGNLALWESIQRYQGEEELTDRLERDIRKAMKELIRESSHAVKAEDQMTLMANRVFETVKEMEEELNRPVTAAEISAKTGIPESRVEAVLKESARAIRNKEH